MPNGFSLMNPDEFKLYHSNPTKSIKSALNIATQLFCHPSCHQACHLPCQFHHPARTLKNVYTILNHNIIPQQPIPPTHPSNPPTLQLPPPPNIMLKYPRQFPIHTILDHKQRKIKDPNLIIKTDTIYLCQWTTLNNNTYNK